MHRALGGLAHHLNDAVYIAPFPPPPRPAHIGLGHGAAGVGLERDAVRHPFLAEPIRKLRPVALRAAGKGVIEAMRALEHRARANEAVACEIAGPDARLRRPARMQPLRPGASARYSMMPLAIEPTTPSASTNCRALSRIAVATPAAAPKAPSTAVGWKPALWMRFGATRLARHMSSQPTAIPAKASRPASFSRSAIASTAGTTTAPACTGPPSNVSSKSSPCAAVPFTNAAPALSSARAWPIAVHAPLLSQLFTAALT